ncbi:hypothetical protein METBIDRAFT_43575 [Metschnikowia bicuspidata var. bicuspidata NRRL YB-4993]|uniref:Uncharacterized protein n=1 Tax=Metschnikowia bicuspidata var. bicuspidata NRRL YB-4993 TaxID=869754 RepID=A0A1A0H8R9_9ASCO|nr:hypothetical protein METBIDRAFT_43575 [Metschnikowia bicuspidata var. bicuspidata NRRL YB-4993]OBA20406.1 hypothetical protein METBIDRAFT_43575 [Metschnikowia bicuspidata var. bicuspidata NRRL YB-4993]
MPDETCAFCLGDNTEVPPFGTLKDAQNMLLPCSTCSLVSHRKCLVDWFNSIPVAQISRNYNPDDSDAGDSLITDTFPRAPDAQPWVFENDVDAEQNVFDVSLRSRWFTVLGQYSSGTASPTGLGTDHANHGENPFMDPDRVFLSAPCPQCKSKITFQVRRLPLLTLNRVIRNTISDTVQYSGILAGLTGAATGIVTMGYVGLARCGVSIIDAIVPVSLISPLFRRNPLALDRLRPQSLLDLLNGQLGSGKSSFLAHQLKFQHIPLLPVMLYRMRFLLLLDCIFRKNPTALMTEWISELLLCNYISSLGNHTLVKQVYQNFKTLVAKSATTRSSLPQLGLLFKDVNWWDPAVMVAATIPARWLYDFIYKFTVNRLHFDLNASVRPRETANSLDPLQLSELEDLETQITGLLYCISQRVKHARGKNHSFGSYSRLLKEFARLLRDRTAFKYFHLKVLYWYYKLKACMQHDYSSTLLYRLAIVTGVTTVLWPFISVDIGKLIYGLCILRISSFEHVDKDKLKFLSNLLGMALVALTKDVVNLFLCHQKARQLYELTVVTQRESKLEQQSSRTDSMARFPGAYEN